jgi:hypothetical protein
MKIGTLRAIAHNVADSLGSGVDGDDHGAGESDSQRDPRNERKHVPNLSVTILDAARDAELSHTGLGS